MPETICLITAPVSTDYSDPADAQSESVRAAARAPKLGVLTLAGALEQAGLSPLLFDLDRAYFDYVSGSHGRGLADFPAWVAPQIISKGVRLFGFSSICSSYPLTLRIAKLIKLLDPDCAILFGGPQASVTDLATLSAFPYVDFILRGEADLSLPAFWEEWTGARRFSAVPGLTWRTPFGPQRNPDSPVILDLDLLARPAYHLHPDLSEALYSFLELGRGCPFSCTFCSTNDFFRRKFRVKSPDRMLADMRWMADQYGFRGFNLVHDMFTVDRRRVAAFCEALISSGEDFNWSCSARTDCVDEDLIRLMARAGCDGIFFGVETGSQRMQRIIDKDLDPIQSRAAVEFGDRLGITVTVSTIVGFPEEQEQDLRETLEVYLHALRQPRAIPQVNILAPLSGTPIHAQYKDKLYLDGLASSLGYQGCDQSPEDRALIREHRDIFSNFYLLPTPSLDRPTLQELAEFLPMCRERLRWLLVALHQRRPDILTWFSQWRDHRMALHPEIAGGQLRSYYRSETSRHDFTAFIQGRLAEFSSPAVEALLRFEAALEDAVASEPAPPANGAINARRIARRDIPIRARGIHVIELDCDLQAVIAALQRGATAAPASERRYYRFSPEEPGKTRLMEIAEPIARSLLLCDGAHTAAQFAGEAGHFFDVPDELRHYAAMRILAELRRQALIRVYRAAPRTTRGR